MKKKGLAVAGLCVLLSNISIAENKRPLGDCPIIDVIDGKSYAINGLVFGILLQMRKRVREMVFGKKEGDALVGLYEFEGVQYNLIELTEVEIQLDPASQEYSAKKADLNKILHEAKEDFLEITKNYVKSIQGFKNQILSLIKESCRIREKEDSFLFKWGEETAGNEGRALRQEVTTIEGFKNFCIDLSEFLEDMARSCPKGKKLFLALMKERMSKK